MVEVVLREERHTFANGIDTMSAPWSGGVGGGGGVVKLKFDNPCIQGLEILSGPCGFLQTDIRVVPMTNY